MRITARSHPEIHRALCAILGERKVFLADPRANIAHHAPRAGQALRALRLKAPDDWREFVVGHPTPAEQIAAGERWVTIKELWRLYPATVILEWFADYWDVPTAKHTRSTNL